MRMIITADWHLRATRPRCRKDADWIETQRKALRQIVTHAKNQDASVFIVGDIFHSIADTSFECVQLVQEFALQLEENGLSCYILAGNHDLPYHSSNNLNRSAIGILYQSDNIFPIEACYPELISAPNFDGEVKDKPFVFRHILTFPSRKDIPPMITDAVASEDLLDDTPSAKWIFTGDYHGNFHYEKNGRNVVNPGCLLRQVSDKKGYQCGIYFVDTDENICEFVPIIDDEELVDDSYILKQEELDENINSFVDKLQKTENQSLDFIENVNKAMLINKFSDDLKEVIYELVEL